MRINLNKGEIAAAIFMPKNHPYRMGRQGWRSQRRKRAVRATLSDAS